MKRSIIFFLLFLIAPTAATAAQLSLQKTAAPVRVNDTFFVDIFLETGQDVINALEGSITFSPNLALEGEQFSGSLVSLWIEKPHETASGIVSFAGILPGGYQGSTGSIERAGKRGNMFTLIFRTRATGTARVAFGADTAAYQDDDKGTRAKLSSPSLTFKILPASGVARQVSLPQDTTPPEPFTASISSSPDLFGGSPFVSFATQDKQSGIDHYEWAATYFLPPSSSDWQRTESPIVLSSLDVYKRIYIKALDASGNVRVITTSSRQHTIALALAFILMVCSVLTVFTRSPRRLRR